MFRRPVPDRDSLMGREIVTDDVSRRVPIGTVLSIAQEPLEFGGQVPAVQRGNDGAIGDVDRRAQLVTPDRP